MSALKKSNETWGELFFVQQSSSSQTPTGNINFIRYNEYLWRLEPLSWLLNRYFRLTRTESLPGKFRFGFGLMSHGQDKGIMMIWRKSNLNVKWLSNSDRIKPGSLNTVRCLWCTIWCNINKQHVNPVSTYQRYSRTPGIHNQLLLNQFLDFNDYLISYFYSLSSLVIDYYVVKLQIILLRKLRLKMNFPNMD